MTSFTERIVKENESLRRRIERLEAAESMTVGAKTTGAALMISAFMGIPGLVGLWPQGFVNDAGDVTDISGNANDMVNTSAVSWTRGGADISPPNAYVSYGDTGGAYFLGKDAAIYDIVGTESWNATATRGLTIGGWFLPTNTGTFSVVYGKWETTGATKAYHISHQTDGDIGFSVHLSTTTTTVVTTGQGAVDSSGWHFCVGRYDPGTELKVWRNRETAINTTSIPATIQSSTGRVAIGSRGDGANPFGGRGGIAFLSNQFLDDDYVEHLYDISRAYYRPSTEY